MIQNCIVKPVNPDLSCQLILQHANQFQFAKSDQCMMYLLIIVLPALQIVMGAA